MSKLTIFKIGLSWFDFKQILVDSGTIVHCAENLFAKKKVHKIIPEKFHPKRLKMVLVFK